MRRVIGTLSRSLNDWELDEIEQLFSRLQGKVVNREDKDRAPWMDSRNETTFSMKSLYASLEFGSSIFFLMRVIWSL